MNKEKGWPRVGKTVFLTREAAQDAPKGGADHITRGLTTQLRAHQRREIGLGG